MKKSKILVLLLAVVMAISLCACGGTSASAPASSNQTDAAPVAEKDAPEANDGTVYTLRYGSNDAAGTDRNVYFEEEVKRIFEEKSGGRLTLEIYPAGSLSKPGKLLNDLQAGTVDIGIDNGTQYPGVYLYTELWGTAGHSFGDYDETAAVLREFSEKYAASEYTGVKFLAQLYSGSFTLCAQKPVSTVADVKGLSVRTSSNYAPWYEAMGATVVSMSSGEVYESLRLNVIDSTMTGLSAVPVFNFQEVCDYITIMPMVTADNVFVMSQSTYDSLPADLQAVIDDSIDEIYDAWNNYMHVTQEKAVAYAKESNPNCQIIELPDDAIAEFIAAAQDSRAAKAAELDAAGRDGTGALAWLDEHTK